MQTAFVAKKTPVTILAVAIALALQAAALPALAQQSPAQPQSAAPATTQSSSGQEPTELDRVEVFGFRRSLNKALDDKRESTTQVDSIEAEDIGKFPDLNLAESLQRIPGVSIMRDAGEGRQISVRGLNPDFTRVRINGMEALTTTGGTDSSGGANRGRAFDFNVFASELFNNITVRKTAAAETEEGSLGATVDLNAGRPLDYQGLVVAAAAQMGYNDLGEEWDPRFSGLISNTWADGTFGALFSLAYTKRALIEEGHSTVRWDNGPSSGGFAASSPFAQARQAGTFHPRIPRYGVLEHEQERVGMTASLQWEPSLDTRLTFDALYADLDSTRTENFLEAVSFSRTGAAGKPATVVRDGVVDGRGNLVYGVFDNVDVRSEARYDELETKFQQYTFNLTHNFSDRWRFDGLIGTSKSEFDNPIQTTITFDRPDADNYIWDYRGNDRLPGINYGFDVRNPANWSFANGLSEIRLRPQFSENTFDTGQLNLAFEANDALTFKGGALWKKYEFSSRELRRASETAVPNLPAGTTVADLSKYMSIYGLDVPAGTDKRWLIPNIDGFANLFNIYCNCGTFALSPNVASALGNNRGVVEEDVGGYVQMDFKTELGSVPISGNLGVRYVETDQESTGYAVVGGAQVLTTVKRKYDDTLPSLNLVAELSDDFLLRFGAAKVMSRPGLGNLTPGVTVSVSGGNRTVNGGNPFLDPFRAKTYDLAAEWYFAPESLLSLAYFYKDIGTFVQTSRETRPFNTSGLPESLLAGTGALPTDDFQFNIPVNTPGGDLSGFELSYQQPFTFLPGFWSHFGALLNYTYVDSKIQYVTATGATSLRTSLTGLSKNAYNATLYYEGDRLSARVSAAYRDEYLTTVPGRNNADVEGTAETLTVDLSASWKLTDRWELSLEGINLTDEWSDQWVDSIGDRASVYHHTGRQYFLGVRFKL